MKIIVKLGLFFFFSSIRVPTLLFFLGKGLYNICLFIVLAQFGVEWNGELSCSGIRRWVRVPVPYKINIKLQIIYTYIQQRHHPYTH